MKGTPQKTRMRLIAFTATHARPVELIVCMVPGDASFYQRDATTGRTPSASRSLDAVATPWQHGVIQND
jgi:hypothetical protein